MIVKWREGINAEIRVAQTNTSSRICKRERKKEKREKRETILVEKCNKSLLVFVPLPMQKLVAPLHMQSPMVALHSK